MTTQLKQIDQSKQSSNYSPEFLIFKSYPTIVIYPPKHEDVICRTYNFGIFMGNIARWSLPRDVLDAVLFKDGTALRQCEVFLPITKALPRKQSLTFIRINAHIAVITANAHYIPRLLLNGKKTGMLCSRCAHALLPRCSDNNSKYRSLSDLLRPYGAPYCTNVILSVVDAAMTGVTDARKK